MHAARRLESDTHPAPWPLPPKRSSEKDQESLICVSKVLQEIRIREQNTIARRECPQWSSKEPENPCPGKPSDIDLDKATSAQRACRTKNDETDREPVGRRESKPLETSLSAFGADDKRFVKLAQLSETNPELFHNDRSTCAQGSEGNANMSRGQKERYVEKKFTVDSGQRGVDDRPFLIPFEGKMYPFEIFERVSRLYPSSPRESADDPASTAPESDDQEMSARAHGSVRRSMILDKDCFEVSEEGVPKTKPIRPFLMSNQSKDTGASAHVKVKRGIEGIVQDELDADSSPSNVEQKSSMNRLPSSVFNDRIYVGGTELDSKEIGTNSEDSKYMYLDAMSNAYCSPDAFRVGSHDGDVKHRAKLKVEKGIFQRQTSGAEVIKTLEEAGDLHSAEPKSYVYNGDGSDSDSTSESDAPLRDKEDGIGVDKQGVGLRRLFSISSPHRQPRQKRGLWGGGVRRAGPEAPEAARTAFSVPYSIAHAMDLVRDVCIRDLDKIVYRRLGKDKLRIEDNPRSKKCPSLVAAVEFSAGRNGETNVLIRPSRCDKGKTKFVDLWTFYDDLATQLEILHHARRAQMEDLFQTS